MSDKYITLKREDWEAIKQQAFDLAGKQTNAGMTIDAWERHYELLDAEVIRHQDLTSGPVLHLYSNVLNAFADLVSDSNGNSTEHEYTEELDKVRSIADYFHNAGLTADDLRRKHQSKLPD